MGQLTRRDQLVIMKQIRQATKFSPKTLTFSLSHLVTLLARMFLISQGWRSSQDRSSTAQIFKTVTANPSDMEAAQVAEIWLSLGAACQVLKQPLHLHLTSHHRCSIQPQGLRRIERGRQCITYTHGRSGACPHTFPMKLPKTKSHSCLWTWPCMIWAVARRVQ